MRIAAFDLDGTLLRGQTACEAIAMGIGRIGRMREFEQLGSNQIEEVMAAGKKWRNGIPPSRSVIYASISLPSVSPRE